MEKSVYCPFCGGEISTRAKSCRHCGSDAETGWSDEHAEYDPVVESDYEESLESEFGIVSKKPAKSSVRLNLLYKIAGAVLLGLALLYVFFSII